MILLEVVIETKILEDRRKWKMEEIYQHQKGYGKTFYGDDYDLCEVKVSNLLKLHNLGHFIVEEDPRNQDSFKALTEF